MRNQELAAQKRRVADDDIGIRPVWLGSVRRKDRVSALDRVKRLQDRVTRLPETVAPHPLDLADPDRHPRKLRRVGVDFKPLTSKGSNLVLNFATSAAGSIHIEIHDEAGRPLPGFALEESPLVWGDDIEHTVRWERSHARATSKEPLKRIAGKPVRLRLMMKDADLFSLRFQ